MSGIITLVIALILLVAAVYNLISYIYVTVAAPACRAKKTNAEHG